MVPVYQTIRCHNSGDHNMNLHYRGNSKSNACMLLMRRRYRWEAGNIRIDSARMFCKGVELHRVAPMAGCREVEQGGFSHCSARLSRGAIRYRTTPSGVLPLVHGAEPSSVCKCRSRVYCTSPQLSCYWRSSV
jgi:hypothetical protein